MLRGLVLWWCPGALMCVSPTEKILYYPAKRREVFPFDKQDVEI